ncbi:major capsid protein [Shewanella halifaxensis]|uniref:major capsid protein n=1 Tax=Shewanella halifaxensis TaxID=271098 RepID=UPI000D59C5B9|nr:major capsid protein [Shewanella halifaxensis]
MDLLQLIASMLTPQFIAETLQKYKKKKSVRQPIRELVFKDTKQHPFSSISVAELSKVLSNVPMVRRGTKAYALDHKSGAMTVIEPQGIDLSDFIGAKELNDLKALIVQQGNDALKAYLETRINDMLVSVEKTVEVLCAQALTGTIHYPMKTDAGTDVYEIDFGETQRFNLVEKLAANTSLAKLHGLFTSMSSQMSEYDFDVEQVVVAGKEAFATILAIANTATKQSIINVTLTSPTELNIGGFRIFSIAGTYKGVGKVKTDKVDSKSIAMIDIAAMHRMYYLALDDLDAGLQPLPFFASHEFSKNPSGVELIGRSKPIPAPVVKAICWCQVLA